MTKLLSGLGSLRSGISRRDLLVTGGLAVAGLGAPGCSFFATEPEADRDDGRATKKGRQAPTLEKLVKEGRLPELADRIPEEPLVIEPIERIGVYGGTWNSFVRGSDSTRIGLMIGYEPLVRWSLDWSTVVPNVAASWTVDDAGQEYVFKLRKGMRWSDGEPFTADDIVFAYEDVLLNPEIYPATPYIFISGGEPGTIEKVDDYTVTFTFAAPAAFFLQYLAMGESLPLCRNPKHFMQQFHKTYNEDADKLAAQEGFDDWIQLYASKTDLWQTTGTPTLHAWLIETPLGDGSQVVATRNPYYFKADSEGSQLPYLDRIVWEVVNTQDVALLKATNGELHAETWESVGTFSNKPVLARSRETGNYHFVTVNESLINFTMIALNLTHTNPTLRETFRNKDFRIGLSLAIDRAEIIKTVFLDQGTPWQGAPRPGSTYAYDPLGEQYAEYDPDAAHQYLDKAGFAQRDADGFRLGPDGKRISFAIDVAGRDSSPYPYVVDAMEFVVEHWRAVGIDVAINPLERSLFEVRLTNNDFDASVWPGGKALDDAIINPDWYIPFNTVRAYAPLWAQWYRSGGETGEPPEGPSMRQIEIYDRIRQTMDDDERKRLFTDILKIAAKEFFAIGIALPKPSYGIVRNDFHNVPQEIPGAAVYQTPGPAAPEQFFLEV